MPATYSVMQTVREQLSVVLVYGQRDRLPEQLSPTVPHRWRFWAKIVGAIALAAGLHYLPPYVTCRNMKERGMFYFGTTIKICMVQQMEGRRDTIDAFTRRLFTSL